eukprot:14400508-Alexandrium_andersonii.AAC.1
MSASLVGSEMCIRDSPCSVAASPRRPLSATRPSSTSSPSGAPARSAGTCLLYTSDAADDM